MDRARFAAHLRTAGEQAVAFARRYVAQGLPGVLVYRVYPNQSYDGNPRVGDEATFPDEALPPGQARGPWAHDAVLDYLWRRGKVPEWIDVAVEAADQNYTFVALRCCGRFTAQEELLYHRSPDGVPPFSIKSPPLPPGWRCVEESGPFDLHWRETCG